MTWYGFAENSRTEEEKYVQHKVTVAISDEQDKSQTNICEIQKSQII